jgi:hypothetical protein
MKWGSNVKKIKNITSLNIMKKSHELLDGLGGTISVPSLGALANPYENHDTIQQLQSIEMESKKHKILKQN